MADSDPNRELIETLPRLGPDQTFRFRCDPQIACFNACCADLNLVLSPYDVLRLRQALALSSRGFIQGYTAVLREPDTGFPRVSLKMRDDERSSCPFVEPNGCIVYPHRPGACRSYPLGRGAGLTGCGAVREQIVLVREEHCRGFEQGPDWTAQGWLQEQGMEPYNRCNDQYLRLVSRWREMGRPLNDEQFALVFLALYRLDEFPRYLHRHGFLERLQITGPRREAIFRDESQRLLFALEWIDGAISSLE